MFFFNSTNYFSLFGTQLHWISLFNCCITFNNICFDYFCLCSKAFIEIGKLTIGYVSGFKFLNKPKSEFKE
jgi:hypothetical protein